MNGLSIALLIIGILLLIFGFNAYHSAGSEVSRLFTGAPTGKSLMLLVSGLASTIIGIAGLFQK